MPVQQGKSALFAKYGAKLDGAAKAHAKDETDYGFVRLPGGITSGVAKMTECGFQQYKAGSNMKTADGKSAVGEWYWRGAGVVVEPTTVLVGGSPVTVRGLQTSIIVPVCATKDSKGNVTSVEDHVSDILNEMRKIAGPEFTEGATGENMELLSAQLKAAGPYFRFSTSQSEATKEFPNPRVWENWNGSKGLEDYHPPTLAAVARTSTNGSGAQHSPAAVPAGATEGEPDLDALAVAAAEGDDDANRTLAGIAEKLGIGTDDVANADSWQSVVEMIRAAQNGGSPDEGGSAGEPDNTPIIKKCYRMTVLDKSGKPAMDPRTKKARKPSEVEVVSVDSAAGTCSVKDLTTKVITKDVAFDRLTPM